MPRSMRFAAVFASVWAATMFSGCQQTPPRGAPKLPAVTVSHPVEREVIDYKEFTGRTAAVDSVEVRARVSGYLKEIYFREGSEVKKGDVLFEIDPRPYKATLSQADGNLASTEARLKRLDADLARAQKVLPTGGISKEEFDKIVGDRGEASASVQALKAAVERAKLDLEFTRVVAPISGRIGRTLLTIGNLVKADDTLLTTIVSIDPIYAYFNVDEGSSLQYQKLIREKKVKSAREAKVPVYLGLANEQGFPHEGVIDFVDNQVDAGTGNLRVRGQFANPERILTPGLFARLRVPFSGRFKSLAVPESAVLADQRGRYVLTVNADNVVDYRPVTAGVTLDGFTAIEKGLTADDWVIVNGLQRARVAAKVQPQRE